MLARCDIQDPSCICFWFNCVQIATEDYAPLTLFKLCLSSDVFISGLIVTRFFGFDSGVAVFNFDVLLFCLLPKKATLAFTFSFAILSSRVKKQLSRGVL